MTSHEFEMVKHHDVGIPEDAYDAAGMQRVLTALVHCQRVRFLKPRNPVPISELVTFNGVRFVDDFRGDRSATVLSRQERGHGQLYIDRASSFDQTVDIVIGLTTAPKAPTKMYTVKNREREQLDALLTYQGSDFVYEQEQDERRAGGT